jgi:hypothetical protein
MSLDIAKKMFREEKRVYCETILTVVPESASFGYSGNTFFVMASNFNIVKVTKTTTKEKAGFKKKGNLSAIRFILLRLSLPRTAHYGRSH